MEYRINTKQKKENQKAFSTFHIPYSTYYSRGFTLVEMIVAVFIFSVVMIVAATAVVTMLDANRKAQATKTVMNNLNFALDSMTRAVRVGNTYLCPLAPLGCQAGSDEFSFVNSDGVPVAYKFVEDGKKGQITREQNNDGNFLPVTAEDVDIDTLQFYLEGGDSGDAEQPRVLVIIRGTAGKTDRTRVSFDLQTLITQRFLDRSTDLVGLPD